MGGCSDESGFLDGSSEHENVYVVESFPIYLMEVIVGAGSSAVAKTVVAPLERVKILFQTRAVGFHTIGAYQVLKKLVNHEGIIQGLYKGNGVSVIRFFPHSVFRFLTYEQYRHWIVNNCSSIGKGPLLDILAGSGAGATAFLCTYPLDLARTKLAYQVVDWRVSTSTKGCKCIHSGHPAEKRLKDIFRAIYKEGGMRGLYRGIGPSIGGILPYASLKFYAYEELRRQMSQSDQQTSSFGVQLCCGAFAAIFAQTVTYPLDVIRRQMQVGVRYKNSFEAFCCIIRNQGWRQLYAGLSLNYIKVLPSVAVGFASYDVLKQSVHVPTQHRL